MKLKISDELSLPKEAVTSTFVVYGGKGMGKTNFASIFCEELHRCNLRFSYLDPIGVSWGLRSSASGKAAGLEILILGGKHGDIPIEPTAGALIADFVVDENVNVIIDFSRHANGKMWGAGEKIRFITAYTNRLFERQGEKRQPLMQIYDEAGRFVPQIIPKGAIEIAECIGAIEQLVELGRNIGIGVSLITQRSARMNKSVSELADVMIAFRTVGPRSVAAIDDWLSENISKEWRARIIDEIRSLPVGKAMIVSPGWLQIEKAIQIRPRQTFDSSSTPKPGEKIKPPKKRAEIDLGKYRERMTETIARATQDNPVELRKQITQLKRELAAAPKPAPRVETKTEIKTIEVPIILNGQLKKIEKVVGRLEKISIPFNDFGKRLSLAASELATVIRQASAPKPAIISRPATKSPVAFTPAIAKREKSDAEYDFTRTPLGKGERLCLIAIAQHVEGVARDTITQITGYKRSSRDAYLQRLRNRGFMNDGQIITATQEGIAALGDDYEPLPTGYQLQQYWMQRLPTGERNVLEVAIKSYPNPVSRETIDEATGYKRSSRDAFISRLQSRRLLQSGGGDIMASDKLFDER